MTGILHYEAFLLAGILLNLTPGNDTFFILSKSMGEGRKAGIVSALGIGAGSFVHTLLAAFGLSVLIARSLFWFNLLKYAGVVYLLYIGYQMVRQKQAVLPDSSEMHLPTRDWKNFRDALLTNLLNPKVVLFFMAFLSQFIDVSHRNSAVPFLILGLTFITTGTLWCIVLAVFAAGILVNLKQNPRVARLVNQACGVTLWLLGFKIAFLDSL